MHEVNSHMETCLGYTAQPESPGDLEKARSTLVFGILLFSGGNKEDGERIRCISGKFSISELSLNEVLNKNIVSC